MPRGCIAQEARAENGVQAKMKRPKGMNQQLSIMGMRRISAGALPLYLCTMATERCSSIIEAFYFRISLK